MAALPVHAPFRNYLESLMLKELEKKNPKFAFSQYIERNQDGGAVLGGYGQFDQWLARDPAAATNWYERQLAEGTFDKSLDGNSPAMVPFGLVSRICVENGVLEGLQVYDKERV
jgi:hypothetical protein